MDELERLILAYGKAEFNVGEASALCEINVDLIREGDKAKQNLLKYIQDNYISKPNRRSI